MCRFTSIGRSAIISRVRSPRSSKVWKRRMRWPAERRRPGFADLTPAQQDALLTSMENGSADGFANSPAFFNRARRLALEGMFGDPYYGGNKNFAGWDLIKYPGPRLATTADDQKMGVEIKPYHHSAYGTCGETMAINLKPVDVAVVGLGAAGGVAVLPLARAGLKVAGIEAGTWMDPAKDFKPDEIHNNVRGLVTTVPKAKREIPTFRTSPDAKARQAAAHPMMNAVGGTSIHYHAQSWRLKPWDFKIAIGNHQTLWREFASQRLDAGGLAGQLRGTGAVLRHRRARGRRFGQGRATFRARWIRRETSTKARGSASIRCLRYAPAIFWITCTKPRCRSAGSRFTHPRRSTRSHIAGGRLAPITAIATAAGATSGPRIPPASPPFQKRKRPRT